LDWQRQQGNAKLSDETFCAAAACGRGSDAVGIWGDATLAKFLRDPRGFLPGNRMAFPGVKDDTQLADLLTYLKQATR